MDKRVERIGTTADMEESKSSVASRLMSVKRMSGKSYGRIAEETGLTNVYVAQLLRRQAQLKADTAPKLQAALPELTDELLQEMMKPPLRSYDPHLIQEPTVYRSLSSVRLSSETWIPCLLINLRFCVEIILSLENKSYFKVIWSVDIFLLFSFCLKSTWEPCETCFRSSISQTVYRKCYNCLYVWKYLHAMPLNHLQKQFVI